MDIYVQGTIAERTIDIYEGLLEDIKQEKVLAIDEKKKYYILSISENYMTNYVNNLFYEMQLAGKVPVLYCGKDQVHLLENTDMLYDLVKKGTILMVDATGILGGEGRNVARLFDKLIENNLLQLVIAESGDRVLSKIYKQIEGNHGEEKVRIFQENIQRLTHGEALICEIPERPKKKKFLGIF